MTVASSFKQKIRVIKKEVNNASLKSGKEIFLKVLNGVAPAIFAASVNETGICCKLPEIIFTEINTNRAVNAIRMISTEA